MPSRSLLLVICLVLWAGMFAFPAQAQEPLVVFLVRHVERADSSADSRLSDAGVQRAEDLATLLHDSGIESIHSTDYVRTRDTVKPIAEALGLRMEIYDSEPADIILLVSRIREIGGRQLIVGHSDTTPLAVRLLGGDPDLEPGVQQPDYDRLYIVTVPQQGEAATVLLRYGIPDTKD